MDRTLSALYDTRSEALAAVDELVSSGVSRDSISVVSGSEPPETGGPGTGYGTSGEEPGFWASLSNLFTRDEDREVYQEGISRGGTTVIAQVDDNQLTRAVDILESHGAVDLDERERSWREEGWSGGYRPGAASLGMAEGEVAVGAVLTASGAAPVVGAAAAREVRTGVSGEEEIIPIAKEELHVGKREVGGGKVRVHTHVVEEPVSEDIRLRDERVTIERTPVDRPASEVGEQAFQERTLEIEERHEEPVVSKEARVTEELRVHKETEEHVEHVEDTVRHTEVDVEDERTSGKRGKKT